jgi:predicted TIM-barrel fold metal-dependent hydrolase
VRVDAHQHLWMRSTVLVQSTASTAETEDLLALAAGSPLIAGVVGWVDLTADDVPTELVRLRGLPGGSRLVGIRHPVQAEADPGFLDRPDVRRGIAAVGAADLAFDLLVSDRQLPAAVRLVRDLPATSFVLDHLGKPPVRSGHLTAWRRDLAAFGALPNVTAKLSGLVTEADPKWTIKDLQPVIDHALHVFGPSRLMFGSDWPVCLLATTYAGWVEALARLLPQRDAADVWSATAVRTYDLELVSR